jgi:hypothetical protein
MARTADNRARGGRTVGIGKGSLEGAAMGILERIAPDRDPVVTAVRRDRPGPEHPRAVRPRVASGAVAP